MLVSERSATRTLKTWDRIAARIVEHNGKMILAGGLLAFALEACGAFSRSWGVRTQTGCSWRRSARDLAIPHGEFEPRRDYDGTEACDLAIPHGEFERALYCAVGLEVTSRSLMGSSNRDSARHSRLRQPRDPSWGVRTRRQYRTTASMTISRSLMGSSNLGDARLGRRRS